MYKNLALPPQKVSHVIRAGLYTRDHHANHSIYTGRITVLFAVTSVENATLDAAPALQEIFSHFHSVDAAFPPTPKECKEYGFFGTACLPFSLWSDLPNVYLEEKTRRLHAGFGVHSARDVAESIAKTYASGLHVQEILASVEKGEAIFVSEKDIGGTVFLGQRPPKETPARKIFPSREAEPKPPQV